MTWCVHVCSYHVFLTGGYDDDVDDDDDQFFLRFYNDSCGKLWLVSHLSKQ